MLAVQVPCKLFSNKFVWSHTTTKILILCNFKFSMSFSCIHMHKKLYFCVRGVIHRIFMYPVLVLSYRRFCALKMAIDRLLLLLCAITCFNPTIGKRKGPDDLCYKMCVVYRIKLFQSSICTESFLNPLCSSFKGADGQYSVSNDYYFSQIQQS